MRHLITLAFLVAAIAAYVSSTGPALAGVFFLLGMLFEGVFWYRLAMRKKLGSPDSPR